MACLESDMRHSCDRRTGGKERNNGAAGPQNVRAGVHIVVQVPRDPRPLRILGLDEPARQLLDLPMATLKRGFVLASQVLGVPTLGDVDVAADVARKTPVRPILGYAGGQQPSVGTIGSAHTVLHEEGRARLDRRTVGGKAAIQVFRMNRL
jgi:hypothetical protein